MNFLRLIFIILTIFNKNISTSFSIDLKQLKKNKLEYG